MYINISNININKLIDIYCLFNHYTHGNSRPRWFHENLYPEAENAQSD